MAPAPNMHIFMIALSLMQAGLGRASAGVLWSAVTVLTGVIAFVNMVNMLINMLSHVSARAASLGPAFGVADPCVDPWEASRHLSGAYSENRLRADAGDGFAMRLALRRTGRLTISSLSFAAPVELTQADERGFVLVTTQLQGHSRIEGRGHEVSGGAGLVVVDSARGQVTKRFSADSRRLNVRIEQERMDALLAQLLGHDCNEPLEFAPAMDGAGAREAWLAILALLLDAGTDVPAVARSLVWARREEMAMLHLLTAHRHNHSALLARPAPPLAPRHVRAAEEHIRHHAADPLTLADIAAAAGTSVRSLTAGFRDFRQTTPMRYLLDVRLDAARRALREATPGSRVTDIALAHGFAHAGRFAAAYRRRFGEAPAASLRYQAS